MTVDEDDTNKSA